MLGSSELLIFVSRVVIRLKVFFGYIYFGIMFMIIMRIFGVEKISEKVVVWVRFDASGVVGIKTEKRFGEKSK